MAIWLDSHAENYVGRGDQGQRLAGCLIAAKDSIEEVLAPGDTTTRPSVFDVSEDDRWVRVALSEEEGRIAVGSSDGFISVLEYV